MVKASANPNAAAAGDLIKVCNALEERYGHLKPMKFTDFIEALIYQILELGVQEKNATPCAACARSTSTGTTCASPRCARSRTSSA